MAASRGLPFPANPDVVMNGMKEEIREYALECGFDACGFAEARPVGDAAVAEYRRWLASGKHFCMDYLARYSDVRDDPRQLLDGARTVISLAVNYYPERLQPADAPQFSYYAYGKDYHDVVKLKLRNVAAFITDRWNVSCRVCVDTAPIRERYWAQQAGIGFIGRNNQLILPGKGSYFFLGEIVTDLQIEPDSPCMTSCGDCRRCVEACPASALPGDYGALDARRCISCLTIEYRGEFTDEMAAIFGNRVYGCDDCQKACPHNRFARASKVKEFSPSQEFLSLSYDSLQQLSEDGFRCLFKDSAVKRTKYSGLMRNISAITRKHP